MCSVASRKKISSYSEANVYGTVWKESTWRQAQVYLQKNLFS
jgi:hypothetical protein